MRGYVNAANMPKLGIFKTESGHKPCCQKIIWQSPLSLTITAANRCKAQIFEQLRHLILRGRLKPGTVIPASRVLAEQLGISRNTVLLVYDRLIAEGYLQARKAIGTYVNLELPETCLAATRRAMASAPAYGETKNRPLIPFVGQPQPGTNAHHLDFDFCPDRIDLDLFPHKIWRRFLNRTLTSSRTYFTECCDPGGLPQLREVIADHLGVARGISVSPDQIIITAGSQEGLEPCRPVTHKGWHAGRDGEPLLSWSRPSLSELLCEIDSSTGGWGGARCRALAEGWRGASLCDSFPSISSGFHITDRAAPEAARLGPPLRRLYHRG